MKRNYLIKVNGERYETHSLRRFYNHVRTIKWQKSPFVYLRVSYGEGYNDGEYTDKHGFLQAFNAFIEN